MLKMWGKAAKADEMRKKHGTNFDKQGVKFQMFSLRIANKLLYPFQESVKRII